MSRNAVLGIRRFALLTMAILSVLAGLACGTSTTTLTDTDATTTTDTEGTTTSTEPTVSPVDLIATVRSVTAVPVTGSLVEIALEEPAGNEIIAAEHNPYDYADVSVSLTFTKPSGATLKTLAFWYKPYEELRLVNAVIDADGYILSGTENVRWTLEEKEHFRVRITPDEAGTWDYVLEAKLGETVVQTKTGSLVIGAAETASKGFVAVDPANRRQFVFDSGESYFPMGLNLAWYSTSLGSHDYDNWFKSLSSVGGNYARIWMANWSFSLHKDSYSDFGTRQSVAIRLDHVLDAASQNGIYVMLTLLNHGQFSAVTNPEWGANVYNAANGGMCEYPIQFFYDTEARKAYKNELLYILSRWGYSENIFAWELFNEVDWVDGYTTGVVTRWHKEMAEFLKANDPYGHLVTTSYKYTFGTDAYVLAAIDFCAVHSYGYGNVDFYDKLLGEQKTIAARYDKPVIFGEIGVDWQSGNNSYQLDYEAVTIRQGAWGGLLGGGAGSANQWWWDSWIQAKDLWGCYAGASAFASRLDLAGKTFTRLQDDSRTATSDADVKVMGYLLDDAVYGYVYDARWSHWNPSPSAITGLTLSLPAPDGIHTLSVYDTRTGELLSETAVLVSGGIFTWNGVTLREDLAFLLK